MSVYNSIETHSAYKSTFPRIAPLAMTIVAAFLLAALFVFMLAQPFERTDDLLWLDKLRTESWASMPFVAAWEATSNFYRPVAEAVLKLCFDGFGLDPVPYRFVQLALLLALIGVCYSFLRKIGTSREAILIVPVFFIGSPFINGSIIWLAEIPHVMVLLCFAGALLALVSDFSENKKLIICCSCLFIAMLSKENGLALAALVIYFLPTSIRWRAIIAFAGFVLCYFAARYLVLQHIAGSPSEDVGYFFNSLSPKEVRSQFPGASIIFLYGYNVLAQVAALWFRITKWGLVIHERYYEVALHAACTAIIVSWLWSRRNIDRVTAVILVVALFGVIFSYAYARDRHLALPALAYGLLLVTAVDRLSVSWRQYAILFVYIAWSAQAAIQIIDLHRSVVDQDRFYERNLTPANDMVQQDIWSAARSWATQ
jgi:hypothetical protein